MHHGVVRDRIGKSRQLLLVGQLAVQNQIRGFEKIAGLGQLLDRVAAILQYALVAVDVGNARTAACGGHETRVIREQPGFAVKGAHIDDIRAFVAAINREIH